MICNHYHLEQELMDGASLLLLQFCSLYRHRRFRQSEVHAVDGNRYRLRCLQFCHRFNFKRKPMMSIKYVCHKLYLPQIKSNEINTVTMLHDCTVAHARASLLRY